MTLFQPEELARSHERYLQRQSETKPKTKADILIEICREDNTYTVAELAEAAERSPSWVRKTLRAAGIALTKSAPKNSRRRHDARPTN